MKQCTVLGCDAKHKARGLCKKHYAQHHKTICKMKDCTRVRKIKGLCHACYTKEVLAGRIDGKMCSVPNCPNISINSKYCSSHRSRLSKKGDVQAHIPLRTAMKRKPKYKVIDDRADWDDWDKEIHEEIKRDKKALEFAARPTWTTESPTPTYKVYSGSGASVLDY